MSAMSLNEHLAAARRVLAAADQEHVLAFWDQLDDGQRQVLLDQVDSVDWPELTRLVQSHVERKPAFKLPENLQPAPWYPYAPPAEMKGLYAKARLRGWELIQGGKVAAFTVAGGQGTRLGWNGPKGTFPATPIRRLPLFGCFAEYIRNMQKRTGAVIPWYIMTSPINDADTRQFFRDNRYFGLDPGSVMIFPQGMMPAVSLAPRNLGKVLLESPGRLALSPNGHGGSLKALWTSGAIADMKKRGIEQISYTQVDNPIVRVLDPIFIGLHDLDAAQMSSKMLPKREPLEKLGNFCLIDGKMTVIEYSDLPDTLAHERLTDGQLRFLAGSIAIHLIRVDFVEALNSQAGNSGDGFALPFHRAEKKVPYIDLKSGQPVTPDKPNAVKLETFVFDALPLCGKSIIYETSRPDEFAPIKNANAPGTQDCPKTSQDLQVARAARWLESQGVQVPRRVDGSVEAVIEISQNTAIYPEDLKGQPLPSAIEPRGQVLL